MCIGSKESITNLLLSFYLIWMVTVTANSQTLSVDTCVPFRRQMSRLSTRPGRTLIQTGMCTWHWPSAIEYTPKSPRLRSPSRHREILYLQPRRYTSRGSAAVEVRRRLHSSSYCRNASSTWHMRSGPALAQFAVGEDMLIKLNI